MGKLRESIVFFMVLLFLTTAQLKAKDYMYSLQEVRQQTSKDYIISIAKLNVIGSDIASIVAVEGHLESIKDNNRCYFKINTKRSNIKCRHIEKQISFDFNIDSINQDLIEVVTQENKEIILAEKQYLHGYTLWVDVLNEKQKTESDKLQFEFKFKPQELKVLNYNHDVVKQYF